MAGKIVAVDLDGVIAEYHGWRGEDHFGPPLEGAREGLERLRAEGWRIIVHTTRSREAARAYLDERALPYDGVNENLEREGGNPGKPIATVYLDDRAVTFRGSWERAVERVLRHRPWNRPDGDLEPAKLGAGQRRLFYFKLVRDEIPEIIRKGGAKPKLRKVQGERLRARLVEKVREELDEYERATPEERAGELVDLLELWRALATFDGANFDALESLRRQKAAKRGAFAEGWILDWVDESR